MPAFIPGRPNNSDPSFETEIELEHCTNGVVHPITKETITKYEKLANDPITQEVWTKATTKELGLLAQSFDGKKVPETIFFMSHDEIKRIPRD